MRSNIFPEILKCIKCDSHNIHYIKEGKVLVCENCESEYIISENIPVFLSKDESRVEESGRAHV